MFKKIMFSFLLSCLVLAPQGNAFFSTGNPFTLERAKNAAKLFIQNEKEWQIVMMDAVKKASFETVEKVIEDLDAEYQKQLLLSVEFLALNSIILADKEALALLVEFIDKTRVVFYSGCYKAVIAVLQENFDKAIELYQKILQEHGYLEKDVQPKK